MPKKIDEDVLGWETPAEALKTNYARFNNSVLHRPVEPAQFGSWACASCAKDSGLLASIGSIGSCYDNSMIRKRCHSQLGWLTPLEFERNRIITVA